LVPLRRLCASALAFGWFPTPLEADMRRQIFAHSKGPYLSNNQAALGRLLRWLWASALALYRSSGFLPLRWLVPLRWLLGGSPPLFLLPAGRLPTTRTRSRLS
jgi:hypothetical protein